ncbi:MAG: hypothetical protein AB7D47_04285 [Desulfovibrio sp.]|jgi:hypothetical protein
MRIHTRIILDMRTGQMLEEQGFEHAGPVDLCKGSGGGSSTTTTVDKEYNRRMAAIAEEQQEMAQEYFEFWKSDYRPMEQEMIEANRDLIAQGKPVRDKFIQESLHGVNPESVAALARSDAEKALSTAEADTARNLARYGVNPMSGSFQDSMGRQARLNRARTLSQASNTSRALARTENYERLRVAMGLGLKG